MEHKSLTINHCLESWVFIDAAGRTGATGFVAGDVGRISYQTDTGQYWRLTATTPTWALIGPPAAYASRQTASVTTAGTTSATVVMAGLNATLTPTVTGKVLVTISGSMYNNNASGGAACGMYYGSGSVPTHGLAVTGTVVGGTASRPIMAANYQTSFSLTALVTGLTVGTQYWFDAGYIVTGGAGTAFVSLVTVSAVELP